jgi:hypothetical protein
VHPCFLCAEYQPQGSAHALCLQHPARSSTTMCVLPAAVVTRGVGRLSHTCLAGLLACCLLQVPGSKLAAMFVPGSGWEPGRDSHGRYYL